MAMPTGELDALRAAFDRFKMILDATTIPTEGGGRRVIDSANATALSEATYPLERELGAATLRMMSPHLADLRSAAEPSGCESIRGGILTIGGAGVPALPWAALMGALHVVAFPPEKWNAMQAKRPGANHKRFHAGDELSAADLAILDAAQRKLTALIGDGAAPASLADPYRPATWFPKGMAARLRMAAHKSRKSKRVATRVFDGVVCYRVADARRWWPSEVPDEV